MLERLNTVSSQCARGKSFIARKPEVHFKIFKWLKTFKNVTQCNDIVVSKDGVIKLLKGLNPSKALGPDKTELGPVFAHLYSAIN